MSAQANVKTASLLSLTALTSDVAIGVDKTWDPDGIDANGVARYIDKSVTVQVGRPTFTISVRKPTSGSRMYKVTVKMAIPTLDITSPSTGTGIQPAPSKAYDTSCVMEFMLPERGVFAERNALYAHVASLFFTTINASDGSPTDVTNTPLRNAVVQLEPVW